MIQAIFLNASSAPQASAPGGNVPDSQTNLDYHVLFGLPLRLSSAFMSFIVSALCFVWTYPARYMLATNFDAIFRDNSWKIPRYRC